MAKTMHYMLVSPAFLKQFFTGYADCPTVC